jgi:hypothetical protein
MNLFYRFLCLFGVHDYYTMYPRYAGSSFLHWKECARRGHKRDLVKK